jgi:hypothetical protein
MENPDFKIILVGMEDAAAVDAELAETRGARDQHDLDVAAVGAETCRKSTSVSGVQQPFYSPSPLLCASSAPPVGAPIFITFWGPYEAEKRDNVTSVIIIVGQGPSPKIGVLDSSCECGKAS